MIDKIFLDKSICYFYVLFCILVVSLGWVVFHFIS